jgi:hypothetical protein
MRAACTSTIETSQPGSVLAVGKVTPSWRLWLHQHPFLFLFVHQQRLLSKEGVSLPSVPPTQQWFCSQAGQRARLNPESKRLVCPSAGALLGSSVGRLSPESRRTQRKPTTNQQFPVLSQPKGWLPETSCQRAQGVECPRTIPQGMT